MNDYTGFIEGTWFFVSLIGFLVSAYSIWDTRNDMIKLEAPVNGRRILGIAILLTEGIRALIQGTWTLVGYWLIEEVGNTIEPTPIVLILIVTNFLILVKTLIILVARHMVRERPKKDGRRVTDI